MDDEQWDETVDHPLRGAFEQVDRAVWALVDGRDEYDNPLAPSPEADTARRQREAAAKAWNDYQTRHGRPLAVEL